MEVHLLPAQFHDWAQPDGQARDLGSRIAESYLIWIYSIRMLVRNPSAVDLTLLMADYFPELAARRVQGVLIDGQNRERAHTWLVDERGEIIDPSAPWGIVAGARYRSTSLRPRPVDPPVPSLFSGVRA